MSARIIPVDPFDYVVFGATGDLSQRKLIPALYYRFYDGQFDTNSRIIGVSRSEMSDEEFQKFARDAVNEFVDADHIEAQMLDDFISCFSYIANDVTDREGWSELSDSLRDDPNVVRAFYLAVAPFLFAPICDYLSSQNYWTPDARVVLEKPLGHNLQSSVEINDTVAEVFREDQVYRIDHYLGKETVQNLLALRFANALFEPIWNSAHIDHIQITAAESVGAGGRSYYEKSGALRDMVQNHLLQLLCLVAMEPPASDEANALRDEKLKVLRALKPIVGETVHKQTVRGQYRGVSAEDTKVPSYVEELGDGATSNTETFVAIKAEVENWRWNGVPFYMRTGKRMARRASEIVIQFREIPHSIFSRTEGVPTPNRLVIRLQPDEGVKLFLMIKDPGPGGMRLRQVPLNLSFADTFTQRTPEAYERLLMDVVRGNQTLFMRRDELEAAWAWIDPIREAWDNDATPLHGYTSGTWGPTSSVALIERDGRTWHEELDDPKAI